MCLFIYSFADIWLLGCSAECDACSCEGGS